MGQIFGLLLYILYFLIIFRNDAAVIPFPSPDTTPPVTKIYFVFIFSSLIKIKKLTKILYIVQTTTKSNLFSIFILYNLCISYLCLYIQDIFKKLLYYYDFLRIEQIRKSKMFFNLFSPDLSFRL